MSSGKLTMVGDTDTKSAKIHDLVKAPANTPWAQERKHSWDARDPATVYYTPETLADGTPTTALTVILRTKRVSLVVVKWVYILRIFQRHS